MQRAWLTLAVLPLWICVTLGSGAAGTFDPLKGLGIDPKAIFQPKQPAVEFQFANFRLNPETGDAARVWTAELKISQSIPANTYLVKTVFQGRGGESLFSGDDIPLPAGHAGKTYVLTRPFQRDARVSAVVLQVYQQAEHKVVATQTYPVSAIASYGIQGATTSSQPAAPQKASDASVKIDTTLDVAFVFSPISSNYDEQQRFRIQNKSAYVVRVNGVSAKAKFLVGIDQEVEVSCPREIQPGQSVECSYKSFAVECPTLASIDVEATLNGNTHHGQLKVDAPIRGIARNPLIRLEKDREGGGSYGTGSGKAEIIIRGSYVKLGGKVTMKAFASVDSDRFPVVFEGYQRDDGIHAEVEVVGTRHLKAPDQFCFHLMEITTSDEPQCGGVGVLLYREYFNTSKWTHGAHGNTNFFLLQKQCK